METWLKNYICRADVTIGDKSDSDHFASKCHCVGKLIRVQNKLANLPECGTPMYLLSDDGVLVPASFTQKALDEACNQAEDILSQGSEDISHSIVIIQHYALEFIPNPTTMEKSFFRVVVYKFKLYNRDGDFRSKFSPDNCMCEPEIRRRAAILWNESRESQRLVESSSHMSSAALTELLANLTSQPSEESEVNMEVDSVELPSLHKKIMGSLKGQPYANLGPFCMAETIVSERDAEIWDSYPEWQLGYIPPRPSSLSQKITSLSKSSGSSPMDKDNFTKYTKPSASLASMPAPVVGLTPDNFMTSSIENHEKDKDLSEDTHKDNARKDCVQGGAEMSKYPKVSKETSEIEHSESVLLKPSASKSPAKSRDSLTRQPLRGGAAVSAVASDSPAKMKDSPAKPANARGAIDTSKPAIESQMDARSDSPASRGKRLLASLDSATKRRFSPRRKAATQAKDNDSTTRNEEIWDGASENPTHLSQKDGRSPRLARKSMDGAKNALKETDKSGAPVKRTNTAGSVSVETEICPSEGDKQSKNTSEQQGQSGPSEGFIVISSESQEKSTEEIADKHDKACQPESQQQPNLVSQCCQVGESLMFMSQADEERLRNAEIQVGASLAMDTDSQSERPVQKDAETHAEKQSESDSDNAEDPKKSKKSTGQRQNNQAQEIDPANFSDWSYKTSSGTSPLPKIGSRTREFMEALANSTTFTSPEALRAPPAKRVQPADVQQPKISTPSAPSTAAAAKQSIVDPNKEKNTDSNKDSNPNNAAPDDSGKSSISEFQDGQKIDSSDDLVPASGEDRPRVDNEVEGTPVPFSQAKYASDGQEKIDLSCSDLSSPKELRYSGDLESTQKSKSSDRLSGASEQEVVGVTKSQISQVDVVVPNQTQVPTLMKSKAELVISQVPSTQMQSTQKDGAIPSQRKRPSFPFSPVEKNSQITLIRGALLQGYTQVSQDGASASKEKEKENPENLKDTEHQKVVVAENSSKIDSGSKVDVSTSKSSEDSSKSSEDTSNRQASMSEDLISSAGTSGQVTSSGQDTSSGRETSSEHATSSNQQLGDAETVSKVQRDDKEKEIPDKVPSNIELCGEKGSNEKGPSDENEIQLQLEIDDENSREPQPLQATQKKVMYSSDISEFPTPVESDLANAKTLHKMALQKNLAKTPSTKTPVSILKTPSSKTPLNAKDMQTPKSGVVVSQGSAVSPVDVSTPCMTKTPGVASEDQARNSTPRDVEGARRRIPIVSPVMGDEHLETGDNDVEMESQGSQETQDTSSQQTNETEKMSPKTMAEIGRKYLDMMKNKEATPCRKLSDPGTKKVKVKKVKRLLAKDAKSAIMSEIYGDQPVKVQTTMKALFNAAPPLTKRKKLLSNADTNVRLNESITPKKPRMGLLQKDGLMLLPEHVEQDKLSQGQQSEDQSEMVVDESSENDPSQSQESQESQELKDFQIKKKGKQAKQTEQAKGAQKKGKPTKKKKKAIIKDEDTEEEDEEEYQPPGTSTKKKKKKKEDQTPRKKLQLKPQIKGLTPKATRRLTLDVDSSQGSPPNDPESVLNSLPSHQPEEVLENSEEDELFILDLLDIINEDLTPAHKSLQDYRIPKTLTNALLNDFKTANVMDL